MAAGPDSLLATWTSNIDIVTVTSREMMLLVWASILIATAAHKVVDSAEDVPPDHFNTTTLFPVGNNGTDNKIKSATSWKVETTFSESTNSTEDNTKSSKEQKTGNTTSSSQEFRPSPHVGNFFDSLEVTHAPKETFEDLSSSFRKPPSAFFGSHKDLKSPNKIPQEVFKKYHDFPFKIESPILTRTKDDWKPSPGGLESKPTIETPVKLPAGSLYKAQDPFRDKPDEEFGLEFSPDFKDTVVKKRNNSWGKLLALITSLIPVGIIISALTPNVIHIQPGPNGQYPNLNHQFRVGHPQPLSSPLPPQPQPVPRPPLHHAGSPPSQLLPPISERCRRRLLCELQNDAYYRSSRQQRGCHLIRCEDPAALSATLSYLLSYQQAASAAFQEHLHGDGDTLNVADHFT